MLHFRDGRRSRSDLCELHFLVKQILLMVQAFDVWPAEARRDEGRVLVLGTCGGMWPSCETKQTLVVLDLSAAAKLDTFAKIFTADQGLVPLESSLVERGRGIPGAVSRQLKHSQKRPFQHVSLMTPTGGVRLRLVISAASLLSAVGQSPGAHVCIEVQQRQRVNSCTTGPVHGRV